MLIFDILSKVNVNQSKFRKIVIFSAKLIVFYRKLGEN